MLDLSPVTLLFVETRAHELTVRVIDDCRRKIEFAETIVFTDKPEPFLNMAGVRILSCHDFPNKRDAGRFYYSEAMRAVNTDFALMMEWDAGIFDADKWLPEFYSYDYIGAPWPPQISRGSYDVGNGGFTLMSKRLGHFICENRRKYPVYTDMDVCRMWRPAYESHGFKWPTRDLASKFAWELGPRNPDHFGYHGVFTWPGTLPREEVIARTRIMLKSSYLTGKSRQLFNAAPWLPAELTTEEFEVYNGTVAIPGLRPRFPGVVSPQQRAAQQLVEVQRRGLLLRQRMDVQNKGEKA